MILLFLLLPVFVLALLVILFLEDRYYERHPEKDRPEVSMWP